MVFPVRATSSGGSASASASVPTTYPASIGTTAGELLILFANNTSGGAFTTPTGWTLLHGNTLTASKYASCYRWYQAGDTAPSVTGSTSNWVWQMHRITGGDPSVNPQEATIATAGSVNPNPPSLTPTWGAKDTLWLATYSSSSNASPTAVPASYSTVTFHSGTVGPGIGTCWRQLNAATEDPGTFTVGASTTWYANTIAVAPLSSLPHAPYVYPTVAVKRSYFY